MAKWGRAKEHKTRVKAQRNQKPREIKLTSKRILSPTHEHVWSHSYVDNIFKHPLVILPHIHFLPFSALFYALWWLSSMHYITRELMFPSSVVFSWIDQGKVKGKLKLEYLSPSPSLPYRGSGSGWVAGLQLLMEGCASFIAQISL